MFRILIVMVLALGVGCADTPEREDSGEYTFECPNWKIEVIEDDRILCVDDYILEREREIIEADEEW